MADRTGIEWTDATWNPIVGCSLVSPGCTNCYAMKMADAAPVPFQPCKGALGFFNPGEAARPFANPIPEHLSQGRLL